MPFHRWRVLRVHWRSSLVHSGTRADRVRITTEGDSNHERNDFNLHPSGRATVGAGEAHSAKAYAAASAGSGLAPTSIQRRAPRPQDVEIEILHCGACHSDLHQVRDEWHAMMPTVYPCVPGHEISGRVVKVGNQADHATRLKRDWSLMGMRDAGGSAGSNIKRK
jgi:hypothetical protein